MLRHQTPRRSALIIQRQRALALTAAGLLAGCAAAPGMIVPASAAGCYRPHADLKFDVTRVASIGKTEFPSSNGSKLALVVFQPGPWAGSFYFVMAPDLSAASIAESRNIGVVPAVAPGDRIRCFVLGGGGTLPDRRGRPPVHYNYFALDTNGDGVIDLFLGEDLDLDQDGVIDLDTVMVLTDRDGDGAFDDGVYQTPNGSRPIPREGTNFMLHKPLWSYPVPFPADQVKQMRLFPALQQLLEQKG